MKKKYKVNITFKNGNRHILKTNINLKRVYPVHMNGGRFIIAEGHHLFNVDDIETLKVEKIKEQELWVYRKIIDS